MRETIRHLRESVANFRSRKTPQEIPGEQIPTDQIPQTAANLAKDAKSIKIAVAAKPGTPLFDSLPQIIESASPDAKIEIVFIADEGTKYDAQALEQMQHIAELAEKRNQTNFFPNTEIGEDDLESLDLDVQDAPEFENLSVFIQDPRNPKQYWFRKIGVRSAVEKINGLEIPAVDMATFPMPTFEASPCPEQFLTQSVATLAKMEEELGIKPKHATFRANVAVARYKGEKSLSLDAVLRLTALKYNGIRQSYQQKALPGQN